MDINNDNHLKYYLLLTVVLSLIIFFQSFVSSDVISINSGGSEQIIVNPDNYIEGFFTGDIYFAVCGNAVIDTGAGETCDDGNTANGDGCSSVCIVEEETGGTGGTGGAGGAGVVIQTLAVSPTEFIINLIPNTNTQRTITLTNSGANAITITPSIETLQDMILMDVSPLTLQGGETKQLSVTFVAGASTGIFTGKIHLGNKEVLITINVKTKLLLFDSNIVVLNKDYIVVKGDELKTRVNLIPLGEKERLDVTLDYTIRDYTGKIYLTKKETLLIEDRVDFDRNFDTGSLPIGKYVVGLELKYPNGVAPSSAHFEVVKRVPITFGTLVLWLIILIILIIIGIIIIIIYKRRKKKTPKLSRFEEGVGREFREN